MKTTAAIDYAVGKYLVVWLTGVLRKHIAEIIQVEPLRLKVTENGPLASLRAGDFVVSEIDTLEFQEDDRADRCDWLKKQRSSGRLPVSGLASLGVSDTSGRLYEILPGDDDDA